MKKLLSMFVALCFLSATAAVSFAQDPPKKDDAKKSGKKKGGKKKEEAPKKDGGK
jgi:hypothetical protein